MSDENGEAETTDLALVTMPCDFDYESVGADAQWLRAKTTVCRRLGRQTVENIVQLGEELIEVRDRLKSNGNHHWNKWARSELGLSEGFITRAVQAAVFCRTHPLTDLRVAPSALYLLTASTTPEAVRQEILSEARQSGQLVTHKQVKSKVSDAKGGANGGAKHSAKLAEAADDGPDAFDDDEQQGAAPERAPWSDFETQIRQAIGTLRMAYKQVADACGYEASTKQMRCRWAKGYSPMDTLQQITALARGLEEGLPVELCDEAPGYVTQRSATLRDRVAS